jgi:hypothetical protein
VSLLIILHYSRAMRRLERDADHASRG